MPETTVPHLKLPLAVDARTSGFATIEQDTIDEIAQCVEVILATPTGTRLDLPEFGAPDFLFAQAPLNVGHALMAAATWESRAVVELTSGVSDELTIALSAAVTARSV